MRRNNVIPTRYCHELSERLMLDTLPTKDIEDVYESMQVGYAEMPPEKPVEPDVPGKIKKLDMHFSTYGVED